eukprot:15261987-Alexandrium_andersonii.AAC.1
MSLGIPIAAKHSPIRLRRCWGTRPREGERKRRRRKLTGTSREHRRASAHTRTLASIDTHRCTRTQRARISHAACVEMQRRARGEAQRAHSFCGDAT